MIICQNCYVYVYYNNTTEFPLFAVKLENIPRTISVPVYLLLFKINFHFLLTFF